MSAVNNYVNGVAVGAVAAAAGARPVQRQSPLLRISTPIYKMIYSLLGPLENTHGKVQCLNKNHQIYIETHFHGKLDYENRILIQTLFAERCRYGEKFQKIARELSVLEEERKKISQLIEDDSVDAIRRLGYIAKKGKLDREIEKIQKQFAQKSPLLNTLEDNYQKAMKFYSCMSKIFYLFGGSKRFEATPVLQLSHAEQHENLSIDIDQMGKFSVMRGEYFGRAFITVRFQEQNPTTFMEQFAGGIVVFQRFVGSNTWKDSCYSYDPFRFRYVIDSGKFDEGHIQKFCDLHNLITTGHAEFERPSYNSANPPKKYNLKLA